MNSRKWLLISLVAGAIITSITIFNISRTREIFSSSIKFDFECVRLESNQTRFFTKYVSHDSSKKSSPLFAWESTDFIDAGYSPERRCQEVTNKLKAIISNVEGETSKLRFMIGTVNQLLVLCHMNQFDESCNSKNMIFTLSKKNRANPANVMASMIQFSALGEGYIVEE
jgi:Circadian oscillating protein COP23